MRKIYQNGWHGIPFKSFSRISSVLLADSDFYKHFYRALFKKYNNPSDLEPEWLELKTQVAEFIKEHIGKNKNSDILSVGCGLGIVEKALLGEGYQNLEVTEVSEDPLSWLRQSIAPDKVHIGNFPDCLSDNRTYDFIYLCSVEYFLDQEGFISLLKNVKTRLRAGGKCIIISWSFESFNLMPRINVMLKDSAKLILEKIGIKHRGQFWGYLRSRIEFFEAMRAAGFIEVNDGLLEKKTRWDTYWIEGKV